MQRMIGKIVRVWARSDSISSQGEIDLALASLDEVLDGFCTLGMRLAGPQVLGAVAEVCRALGRKQDALMYLDGGLSLSADTGQPYWDAELQRLKGEVLLEEGGASEHEVERLFQLALDLSQNQAARALELRASTSLAQLWRRQEKRGEARALLVPIYDWFAEGFDTQDLKAAKALLDELM